MNNKKYFFTILLSFLLSNCSVFMAAKQPDAKDMSFMRTGIQRSVILAEYGMPISTEVKNGKKIDILKFVDGYSTGAKIGRTFLHGSADIATLGLWELVGTPTEVVFDGTENVYQVTYDENDIAKEIIPIKN